MRSSSTALTLALVPTFAGLALLLSLLTPIETSALTGVVLDSRTHAPIPNAEVTIAGQRGSVRTGIDGSFDWAIALVFPIVITVILPDGRVARPVRLETADGNGRVRVLVESVIAESVQVVGTA